jgi:hypothetical protein
VKANALAVQRVRAARRKRRGRPCAFVPAEAVEERGVDRSLALRVGANIEAVDGVDRGGARRDEPEGESQVVAGADLEDAGAV